ncbi:hypothetical protein GGX14DRAFT_611222 [Mycena pura]|uniref:F-box domain-containing protein n=1 Tax=Mycena pura TaxID=153505 RepID=A0AAD6Y2U3_9AGAR|nr:hypothetical protein GGX14DRAFT_611222 [Mycena pura]
MKLLQALRALRRRHFGIVGTRARRLASIPQRAISAAALPVEIQYLIIDEFEGQIVQLREICRVCLAWAEHAQALLFRSICLRNGDRGRFLAVLDTTRNLGRHVTALKVVEDHGWWNGLLEGLKHALVEQLPSLRTLDVSCKRFSRLSEYATGAPLHSAMISRLCLHSCAFETSDTLVAFVATFPRLQSLYIAQCTGLYAWPRSLSLITRPAWHLKYLALDRMTQKVFFDWMVAEPAALTVDHLRIISLGPDASMFNALLHRIGASLSHLELPNTHHLGENTDIPLSIRACTALTALTFRVHGMSYSRQGMVSVLEQVASAAPPVAVVFFHIPRRGRYRGVQWELVDASLDTDAFPHLERVEFRISRGILTDAHWVTVRLHLASRMVLLHARGLLQFVDGDDEGPTAAHILAPLPEPPRPMRRKRSSRLGGWLGRAGLSIPRRAV